MAVCVLVYPYLTDSLEKKTGSGSSIAKDRNTLRYNANKENIIYRKIPKNSPSVRLRSFLAYALSEYV